MRGRITALLGVTALAGCMGGAPQMGGAGSADPEAGFFAGLPTGAEQLKVLCGRGQADRVASALCAANPPALDSLAALQRAVGLFDGQAPPEFALTGHSTSLVAREVSSINPRAILFTAPSQPPTQQQNDGSFVADPGFVAMGFARGEQLVELVAHDPQADELHFYLVRFTQACNAGKGCSHGDLFTPAIEHGWTGTTVYEDQDLKNTTLDCLECHQPDGPGSRKILRMQERRAPWTHWFRNNKNQPGGESLFADFVAAHGPNEDYAGIPAALLGTARSDPLQLEALVENNSLSPQPNEFNGSRIESEVDASAPAQPAMNSPMGQSQTWMQIHEQAAAGQDIPVPYHDVKVSDPVKLAQLSDAYRAVMSGGKPLASLPDLREVFLDEGLADMGFAPDQGLSGAGIVVEMCARCHNSHLDQTLSRARFDATALSSMSRAEKDQAIARMKMPAGSAQLMPPARTATLSASEIDQAVAALQQ